MKSILFKKLKDSKHQYHLHKHKAQHHLPGLPPIQAQAHLRYQKHWISLHLFT